NRWGELRDRHGVLAHGRLAGVRLLRTRRGARVPRVPAQLSVGAPLRDGRAHARGADGHARPPLRKTGKLRLQSILDPRPARPGSAWAHRAAAGAAWARVRLWTLPDG